MARLYVNPTLDRKIRDYCEANGIEDVNAFANRCVQQGLNVIKYGTSPIDNIKRENNGIKDISKNEKSKKENIKREDFGEQNDTKTINTSQESKENVEPVKKEQVTVRKIQIIKKK